MAETPKRKTNTRTYRSDGSKTRRPIHRTAPTAARKPAAGGNRSTSRTASKPGTRKPAGARTGTGSRPTGGNRTRRGGKPADKPQGKGRGGKKSGRGIKRGSSASHRAIEKIKKQFAYTMDVTEEQRNVIESVPLLADGDIRVVPVCGTEWIGTNMSFVEYKDEIVIIDAGFAFGNPDTPGIEYTIPNVAYLKSNKHKIKALVITHGHLDHVGAIPYVIEDLGFPPIYTMEFGGMFIKKKIEEFPQIKPNVKIEVIDRETGYTPIEGSDHFKVKFFGLTHSIPDSSGVIVQTPLGGIVSTGDVRVESVDGVPVQDEFDQYEFFKDENILLLLMDSTNIERKGWSASEKDVYVAIDEIIRSTNGRLFIATFSSQVERIMSFLRSAKKHGKYVIFEGRSIISNMGIAEQLELEDFSHVIPLKEADDYPPNKLVYIITGAQGEQFAALNRAAIGEHKHITFNQSDTIVLSSSIIPGNDHAVSKMKNSLYKGSYQVIAHSDNKVHASGHGNREELKWVHSQIPYKFFMPVHGKPYMIRLHEKMAREEINLTKEQLIVPADGAIVEIRNEGTEIVKLDERLPHEVTVIDGSYYGPLHRVVMDDRQHLHEHGMFVVVVSLDIRNGRLKKSPDIISRGFVYLRESKDLLNKTRDMVKRSVEQYAKTHKRVDFDEVKDLITNKVSTYLRQNTHKEPIVIPVVLGV